MDRNSKIYVAGNTGLVGSAIVRKLKLYGYNNLVFTPFPEYDLRKQQQVDEFFKNEKPEYVFLAAAKVGGILANNNYKAEFIYDNIMIEFNVIHAAYVYKVKKLLFLGSSCIYPKNCSQPIKEEYLLTGALEPTNEPYALAKINGLKMCDYYREQYGCDFISAMPTNIYGPYDNYNLETAHVLPALIRKIHLAKLTEIGDFENIRKNLQNFPFSTKIKYNPLWTNENILDLTEKYGIYINSIKNSVSSINFVVNLKLWGSGSPYREFLYSDDLADALIFLMNNYSAYGHINIGTGKDIQIKELAIMIKNIIGFNGKIEWDTTKPDGTPRKLLDVSKLKDLGWEERINIEEGIMTVYENYF